MRAVETVERGNMVKRPAIKPGDTVRVHVKVREGDKERIQVFEGVCIHRKNKGLRGSFTVRKVTDNVGVERVWSLASPRVTKIELVSRGKVRRSKLYYLRDRRGNAARIKRKVGEYKTTTGNGDLGGDFTPETNTNNE